MASSSHFRSLVTGGITTAFLAAAGIASTNCGTDTPTGVSLDVDASADGSKPDSGGGENPATSFAVGGKVIGLTGTGLVLQNNSGDDIGVAAKAGTFAFPKKLATGAPYAVKVKTNPSGPLQTCTVTKGTGTVGSADVTDVEVTCVTSTFQICATVTGLQTSTGDAGLDEAGTGGLVLKNNGGDAVSVTSDGARCFTTKVPSGGAFAVTVDNPTNPHQTCTVSGGTGTVVAGDVSAIAVNCTINKRTLGGTVSFLDGTLELSAKDGAGALLEDVTVNANGTFSFATPLPSGQAYSVEVKTQPANGTCVVKSGATGIVANTDITSVIVGCNTSRVFDYTGAEQTFVVPADVTTVALEVFGAESAVGTGPAPGASALGGSATGTLTVAPADTLYVFVGGAANGQTGGFNGGGNGGNSAGGGGGGASDVRITTNAPENRVVVAGGGGGGGASGCEANDVAGGNGGAGGGGIGLNGTGSANGGGGFGGDVNIAGAAGIGCGGFLGAVGTVPNGGAGQACCCFSVPRTPGGGGGGGGYLQGGGGGGGSAGTTGCSGNDKGGGGGGAGGSSYIGGVAGGATVNGVRAGNGQVKITFPATP